VEAAEELAKYEISHVKALKDLIEQENIDCDFTLTRTCNAFRNQEIADKIKPMLEGLVNAVDYMDDLQFTDGRAAEGVCRSSKILNWS
jgi:hypothetical protein